MGERTFADARRSAAAAGRGPALRNSRFMEKFSRDTTTADAILMA